MTDQLRVLVITTMAEARARGAKHGTCRHHDKPDLQFWWPGLGLRMLVGREFDVVCIGIELGAEMRDWLSAHLLRRGRTGTTVVQGMLWR